MYIYPLLNCEQNEFIGSIRPCSVELTPPKTTKRNGSTRGQTQRKPVSKTTAGGCDSIAVQAQKRNTNGQAVSPQTFQQAEAFEPRPAALLFYVD
jgi:hypothetical protein